MLPVLPVSSVWTAPLKSLTFDVGLATLTILQSNLSRGHVLKSGLDGCATWHFQQQRLSAESSAIDIDNELQNVVPYVNTASDIEVWFVSSVQVDQVAFVLHVGRMAIVRGRKI